MGNKKDKWSQLSMQQRADLIKLYIQNGVNDLKIIRNDYNSFSGEENHPVEVRQGLQNGTIKAVQKEDGTFEYIRTVPKNKTFLEKAIIPNYRTEDFDKKLAELYTRVSGGWDGSLINLRRHGIPGLAGLYKRKRLADSASLDDIKNEAIDITNNRDYTGVVTTNDKGFKTVAFGSKAIKNELGYNPDFVAPLFEDVVPEGIIVKKNDSKGGDDHRGESHLVRSKQQKHINKYGEPYRIFQLHDEILDKNIVNYLDSLVNVGDNSLKLETVNTSLPFDSAIRIDDGGNPYSVEYAYDGQNLTKVTAKDKEGNERVKYIDIFDANPENEGIKINWITKPILNLFEKHSKPYIVTTPWM